MAAKYYTILTEVGKTKVANAAALGRQIKLTQLAVGDGNGSEYDPVESQASLKQETYRTPISHLGTDAQNPNWVIAEGMIPVDVGGWFVREVGLFDEDGDLFAIGKYPETYKPTLAEGTGRDLYIRFIMVVSNTEAIDLKIDPTVAIATKEFTKDALASNSESITRTKQLKGLINDLIGKDVTGKDSIYVDDTNSIFNIVPIRVNTKISKIDISKREIHFTNGSISRLFQVGTPLQQLHNAIEKMIDGNPISICCYGDSMTYGFDLNGTGEPVNGSNDKRAEIQYPSALGSALFAATGVSNAVINRGFPGDTSRSWKTRWPSSTYSDVVFIMYGHNDAKNIDDVAGNSAEVSCFEFKNNIEDLIVRELKNGSAVILLLPPSLLNGVLSDVDVVRKRQQRIMNYRGVLIELSKQYKIPFIDVSELVGWMGEFAYSDNTHYNSYGYNEWGWNLASVLLPGGLSKSYASGDFISANASDVIAHTTYFEGKTRYDNDVIFSLVRGSRDYIVVYGHFTEDVFINVTTLNVTGSNESVAIVKSGGDRSGLHEAAVSIVNDGSSITKRKTGSLLVNKGYRTVFIQLSPGCNVSSVEAIKLSKNSLGLFGGDVSLAHENISMRAIGTSIQSVGSDAQLHNGGMARIDCHLPSGDVLGQSGLLLYDVHSNLTIPNKFIWLCRFQKTKLHIRKFKNSTPEDEYIDNAFSVDDDDFFISLGRKPDSSGEIFVYINNVLVTTLHNVDEHLTGSAYIGLVSANADLSLAYTRSIFTSV
ncbi:TPA: phage tail protein [Vibrio parahaemolyticus]|nr:phage tail protein [Vibrio parahaemolyticus]